SISSASNLTTLNLFIKADHGLDQHIYNALTASQVAAVQIEGNNPINHSKRDIVV
ncbi:8473_t:CDS:1, partial [Ambispora leptoticha]